MEIYNKPKYNKVSNKWEILVSDSQGNYKKTIEYDDQQTADKVFDDVLKSSKQDLVKKETDQLKTEQSYLEAMVGGNAKSMSLNDIFGEQTDKDEEIKKIKKDFKKRFDQRENKCMDQAKQLLMSAAKAFLDGKLIQDEEYIKYKLKLESKTLSFILFQLDIIRQNLYTMQENVEVNTKTGGYVSSKTWEAMASYSRVALDITKFMTEYNTTIQKEMKALGADMEITQAIKKDNNTEDVDAEVIVHTSNRKKLLQEISAIVRESEDTQIPKSKNTKLHDDDPRVVEDDQKHIDIEEEVNESKDDKFGLDTFEAESEAK